MEGTNGGAWSWASQLLCRSIAERPSKIQRTSPSVGEVFEELVAGSPSISSHRALKSRRRTGQSAEELERALKEKWSLVLVKFIQEASLPVSERMEAINADSKAWIRLFGGRVPA